jgi:hypothetical protein
VHYRYLSDAYAKRPYLCFSTARYLLLYLDDKTAAKISGITVSNAVCASGVLREKLKQLVPLLMAS